MQTTFFLKQACCTGCRRRPFPLQLHQQAKSTHSVKQPELLNQSWDCDVILDFERPKPVRHSLFYDWKTISNRLGLLEL